MGDRTLTLKEAAERIGVSPATLRRWAEAGVIPEVNGHREWTEAAVAHARIVAVSGAPHLRFEAIGSVKLKGFHEPRELYRFSARDE